MWNELGRKGLCKLPLLKSVLWVSSTQLGVCKKQLFDVVTSKQGRHDVNAHI